MEEYTLIIPVAIPTIVSGENYMSIPVGWIVRVIDSPRGVNTGNILMKMNSKNTPFINVEDGNTWGTHISRTYQFLIIGRHKYSKL